MIVALDSIKASHEKSKGGDSYWLLGEAHIGLRLVGRIYICELFFHEVGLNSGRFSRFSPQSPTTGITVRDFHEDRQVKPFWAGTRWMDYWAERIEWIADHGVGSWGLTGAMIDLGSGRIPVWDHFRFGFEDAKTGVAFGLVYS